LRVDHSVGCWGRNDFGQADPPDGAFVAVSAGGETTCGLRTDSSVDCWGRNDFGQADPPDGQFRSLSVAASYACGIRVGQVIECWGEMKCSPQHSMTWPTRIPQP